MGVHIYMNVGMFVCIHVCLYLYYVSFVCVYVRVYMCVCVNIYIYIWICNYIWCVFCMSVIDYLFFGYGMMNMQFINICNT